MARYTVGLAIQTYVWANVTVEAESQEAAEEEAVRQARAGDLDFEYADWNTDEVEADFCDLAMEGVQS